MAVSEKDLKEAPQRPTPPSLTTAPLADVSIYSDGLCIDGVVGTGLAIFRRADLNELWYGLHSSDSTSRLAELKALHHALLTAKDEIQNDHSVAILSDSAYAVWIVTDQRTSSKLPRTTPKSHAAIIIPMRELYVELEERLTIQYVKHNSLGNKLAKVAASWAIDFQEEELRRYSGPMEIEEIFSYSPE